MRAVSAPAKPKAPARPAARRTGPAPRSSCGRRFRGAAARAGRASRTPVGRCSTGARVRRRSSCSVRSAVLTGVLLDAVRLPRVLTEVCAAKATRRAPSGRTRRGKMWAAARNFSCGVRKGAPAPHCGRGDSGACHPNRGCRCASSRAAAVQAAGWGSTPASRTGDATSTAGASRFWPRPA